MRDHEHEDDDLRGPTITAVPSASALAARAAAAQPPLQAVHGAVVGLVVVAQHVQEAVEGQDVQLLGQRAPEARARCAPPSPR